MFFYIAARVCLDKFSENDLQLERLMKLAFLIYSYFPYGGQQRDFRRIAQEALNRGHEVTVFTLKWRGETIEKANIKIVPVSSISRTSLYRQFTAWTHKALSENAFDLIVGFNKMPGLDVYFAADPCFAEKAEQQRGAYYRFTPRYRHFLDYEKAVFSKESKTKVLYLSNLQHQAFEKYYPQCGPRLYQVPPGIDRDRVVTDAAPVIRKRFREEFALNEEDMLVLQVGSGFKVKGVDRSLQAIASLPEPTLSKTQYLLIGQDKPNKYYRLAKRLGIGKKFTVLPGRDDIPRFLLGADLLLHPAYGESAGYVLLEATIAGLPALTTAACGYANHIENARSGLVCSEPFQQSELNEKLSTMLTSKLRSNWIQDGLDYGKQPQLYSLAVEATDLLEAFENRHN
jgi:UDP-glucose:(heptosyl)LPS alpha-1,3-glucosyltransferase